MGLLKKGLPSFILSSLALCARQTLCIVAAKIAYSWATSAHKGTGHAKVYIKAMWLILQQEKPYRHGLGAGNLSDLVTDVMVSDAKIMKKNASLVAGGYKTLNYFE